MLVKKQRSQKKIIISGLIMVAVIVVGYFVYNFVLDEYIYNTDSTSDNDNESIYKFDKTILEQEDYIGLRNNTQVNYADQNEYYAYSQNIPSPVRGLEVKDPGFGKVLDIFWQEPNNNNYSYFRVYRSTDGNNFDLIVDNLKANHLRDEELTNNKIYYYIVGAVIGENETLVEKVKASPTDVISPESPKEIDITFDSTKEVVMISWISPSDSDFSHVNIYRSTVEGGLGALIGKVSSTSVYVDSEINIDNTYYYTLTSVDINKNESSKKFSHIPLGKNNPFELFDF